MNIIYMHSHDTGRRISPYGYAAPTVHLDDFARKSILFTNAFAVAPTCSPSRAALLTGRYPHEVGMLGLAHLGFSLHNYEDHLVGFLNRRGYTTALCGVQHVAPDKQLIGYHQILDEDDDYFNHPDTDPAEYDKKNAERTAAFIHHHLKQKKSTPFFLSFGLLTIHRPFPTIGDSLTTDLKPLHEGGLIPESPEEFHDYETYRHAAVAMDKAVGTLLHAIDQTGIWDDTVIVYANDHGIAFPDMKGTLRDAGIEGALILWVPERLRGKLSHIETLVSQIDLFPTLLELAGIRTSLPATPQNEWDARSLLPLIRNEQQSLRSAIFSEKSFHVTYDPARSVRTSTHKLIRRYGSYPYRIAANCDDSPSKYAAEQRGFFRELLPEYELYDLHTDPEERHNLAEDSALKDTRTDLESLLQRWMETTGDPLLSGEIIPPEDAIIDPPEAQNLS